MSYAADVAASVVRYEAADRAALREFQRRHFETPRQSDDAFFDWLYQRNPCRDPEGPPFWVCRRGGEIVGQLGTLPYRLKVGDTTRRAHWLIDWMVDPQWRLRGVAAALLGAFAAHAELMTGLGFEDQPWRAALRAGWTDVGTLSLFVRPLDLERCAKVGRVPALLTRLAPRAIVGGSAGVLRFAHGTARGMSFERIGSFDERAEAVWRAASPDYAVLNTRDLRYLGWRFDDGPHAALFERYYLVRRGAAIGYAVVRMTTWRGERIGRLVDFLCPRNALPALFAHVIDVLRGHGAIAVFFEQCHPDMARTLRRLGCLHGRPSHRYVFKQRDPDTATAAALTCAENWFLTPGDGDFDQVLVDTEGVPPEPEPSASPRF